MEFTSVSLQSKTHPVCSVESKPSPFCAMRLLVWRNPMLQSSPLLRLKQRARPPMKLKASLSLSLLSQRRLPSSLTTATQLVSGTGGFSFGSGDFFANKVLEHIRITAEGNVGIGVPTPLAKLDVAGMIRASQGIVFPDGSIQYSAATKTYGDKSSLPGAFSQSTSNKFTAGAQHHIDAAGTGTLNFLPKWAETGGAGTLTNSAIFELDGAVGIGTNNPQTGLDYHNTQAPFFTRDFPTNPGNAVAGLQLGLSGAGSRNVNVGPSFLFFGENSAGTKSFLGRVSAIWENPTAGSEAGAIFFQTRANSADVNALTERMRITASGNVGIGTSSPNRHLHIFG